MKFNQLIPARFTMSLALLLVLLTIGACNKDFKDTSVT